MHYRGKTGWWWCSSGAVGLWGAGTAILVLLELFMTGPEIKKNGMARKLLSQKKKKKTAVSFFAAMQ